jgi:hypothetical protein
MVQYGTWAATVTSLSLLGAHPAGAATVVGKLVDLACYIQENPRPLCDRMYALEGFEAGVISTDGKIYHLRGAVTKDNNAKLLPFIARNVTVSGDIAEKNKQLFLDGIDLKNSND